MRRSRIEIFLTILQALILHGSLRVTHLMRKANVKFTQAKEFLQFSIDNFIVNKKGYSYSITPTGVLLYRTLTKFWKKEGKQKKEFSS